jgi:hypothetical protein
MGIGKQTPVRSEMDKGLLERTMMQLTWFWMLSLTRSMGAAAVLETAAETPPTARIVSYAKTSPAMPSSTCQSNAKRPEFGGSINSVAKKIETYSGSRP